MEIPCCVFTAFNGFLYITLHTFQSHMIYVHLWKYTHTRLRDYLYREFVCTVQLLLTGMTGHVKNETVLNSVLV